MSFTELITTIIVIILMFALHLEAMPHTKFSKWGEKKFGSYGRFMAVMIFVYTIPLLLEIIYFL